MLHTAGSSLNIIDLENDDVNKMFKIYNLQFSHKLVLSFSLLSIAGILKLDCI